MSQSDSTATREKGGYPVDSKYSWLVALGRWNIIPACERVCIDHAYELNTTKVHECQSLGVYLKGVLSDRLYQQGINWFHASHSVLHLPIMSYTSHPRTTAPILGLHLSSWGYTSHPGSMPAILGYNSHHDRQLPSWGYTSHPGATP